MVTNRGKLTQIYTFLILFFSYFDTFFWKFLYFFLVKSRVAALEGIARIYYIKTGADPGILQRGGGSRKGRFV